VNVLREKGRRGGFNSKLATKAEGKKKEGKAALTGSEGGRQEEGKVRKRGGHDSGRRNYLLGTGHNSIFKVAEVREVKLGKGGLQSGGGNMTGEALKAERKRVADFEQGSDGFRPKKGVEVAKNRGEGGLGLVRIMLSRQGKRLRERGQRDRKGGQNAIEGIEKTCRQKEKCSFSIGPELRPRERI